MDLHYADVAYKSHLAWKDLKKMQLIQTKESVGRTIKQYEEYLGCMKEAETKSGGKCNDETIVLQRLESKKKSLPK